MSLKKIIYSTSDSYERIKLLKDKCKGKTIYIVSCGPSLTSLDRDKLIEKLKGKIVLACKQAYANMLKK